MDPAQPAAVAGESGWNYQQRASGDFDGDGDLELLVLTARVDLLRGQPLWDDGQPWQAYVEETDGTRTHVYARFVQLGTVIARVTIGDGDRSGIVLVEHMPELLAVYEVDYRGPGRAEAGELVRRRLDARGERDPGDPSGP